MKAYKLIRLCSALVLVFGLAASQARAQAVNTADIQRLEDSIDDVWGDVSDLRSRDSVLAQQLEAELDDLRDEATYLKVKLRKREAVRRNEISDVQDRLDDIRARARGDISRRSTLPTGTSGSRPTRTGSGWVIPVGTEFDVRLQTPLNSKTAQVEDRFEGTTMVDLLEGDRMLVPAGSIMRGIVSSVTKAGRLERKGSLTLAFDQLTIGGRSYPIRATVTQALESEGIRGEVDRIGAGAGIGAIIGGIIGGLKGAITGILIGAGGTIAATEGTDVELPAGTVLRVRLDTPLEIR